MLPVTEPTAMSRADSSTPNRPAKRVRLHGKQADPAQPVAASAPSSTPVETLPLALEGPSHPPAKPTLEALLEFAPKVDAEEWKSYDNRRRGDTLRCRTRRLLWEAVKAGAAWPPELRDSALEKCTSFKSFRDAFQAKNAVWKEAAMQAFIDLSGMAAYAQVVKPQRKERECRTTLLTYIMKDFVVTDTPVEPSAPVEVVAKALEQSPQTKELCEAFLKYWRDLAERLKATDSACCCELCPETWKEQHRMQLHFHGFLLRSDAGLLPWKRSDNAFQGAVPFESWPPMLSRHGRGRSAQWSGCFYVSVAKFGSVWRFSTKQPFVHYPVNTAWVVNLLQASKISAVQARGFVARCIQGSTRVMADIAQFEVAERAQRIHMYREGLKSVLSSRDRPFEWPPQVVAWYNSFASVEHRYSFLILDGPSQMGKTCFARILKPAHLEAFEVNCAGGAVPNLRTFCFFTHGCIIYDEIGPRMVWDNHKLFQSSDAEVQMAASPTNIHGYSVYVHRVRQICCANNWARECSELDPDVRAWIERNSVYVKVDKPLFAQ